MSFAEKQDGKKIVIALDGPAGVGKSSVGKELALKYGLDFLSTGEMYRCLGWKALIKGISLDDKEAITQTAKDIKWSFKRLPDGELKAIVDGVLLGDEMLKEEVGSAASKTSAVGPARAVITKEQQELACKGGIVLEGRDIGTVVCPQTPYKFYLTASAHARAKRRVLQLREKGQPANYEDILASIKARDERDSSRAAAPLKAAPDAVVIDTSFLTLRQVVEEVSKQMHTAAPVFRGLPLYLANLIKFISRMYFKLFYKIEVKGLENIPLKGKLIIAANHISNFDPPFAGCFIGQIRDSIYVVKKEIMAVPVVGWIFKRLSYISMDRHKKGGDLSSIKACLKVIEKGHSLFIFPEGTRSKTGKMGKAKAGVGFLAYHSGVDILPVKVSNTDKLPFTRAVLKVTYGKPFKIKAEETKDVKEQFQDFADKIMQEISKLD